MDGTSGVPLSTALLAMTTLSLTLVHPYPKGHVVPAPPPSALEAERKTI